MKSIFDLVEFKQYKSEWDNRQEILTKRSSYYDGSIYDSVRDGLSWLRPRFYKGIKPLYLPLSRAVDIDAGIIPGGWQLPEDEPKTELWQKAIGTVFDWSNWDTEGVLYVHYGAQYGVSGLKISDLREIKRVLVQPFDPLLFMLIGMRAYDNTPDMSIQVEKRQGENGQFEYAEIITPDSIRTFRDATPYGYDGRDPEYKNELGFVPYVEIRHVETGKPYGEATYQKSVPLLNEVNELASYLADIIRKNADAQWAVFGAEPSDLTASNSVVWFFPQGADAKALVPGIDIDGVLGFIQEISQNVKDSLPELSFDELRSKDQIATASIELQLTELITKIKRVRPNYDKGLKIALQMAGRAAAQMGISDIAVLDDEELRFDPERDILPQDEEQIIRLEMSRLELEQMQTGMGINEGENA